MNIRVLQSTPSLVSFKADRRVLGHKGCLLQHRQQQQSKPQRVSPCKALEIDWTSADTLVGLAGGGYFAVHVDALLVC